MVPIADQSPPASARFTYTSPLNDLTRFNQPNLITRSFSCISTLSPAILVDSRLSTILSSAFKSESSSMASWLTWKRPLSYIGTSFSRSFSSILPVNGLTITLRITLRIRFEQWGVQPDLNDAIELRRDALGFCALRPSN